MAVLQTSKTTQETAINHGIKTPALPELTANLLRDKGCLIDKPVCRCMEANGHELTAQSNQLSPAIRYTGSRTGVLPDDLGLVESGLDWHVRCLRVSLCEHAPVPRKTRFMRYKITKTETGGACTWKLRGKRRAILLHPSGTMLLYWMTPSRCTTAKKCRAYPVILTIARGGT